VKHPASLHRTKLSSEWASATRGTVGPRPGRLRQAVGSTATHALPLCQSGARKRALSTPGPLRLLRTAPALYIIHHMTRAHHIRPPRAPLSTAPQLHTGPGPPRLQERRRPGAGSWETPPRATRLWAVEAAGRGAELNSFWVVLGSVLVLVLVLATPRFVACCWEQVASGPQGRFPPMPSRSGARLVMKSVLHGKEDVVAPV
jgi:hypothetical protein